MSYSTKDFQNMIAKSATQDRQCRLTTKFNRPVFGKFVDLADAAELAAKGYYRFVLAAREADYLATGNAVHTKMYKIETIIFIDFYN